MTEQALYRRPNGALACTECGLDQALCSCGEPNDAAHKRLWSREGRTASAVWRALQQEVALHPPSHDWMAEATLRVAHVMLKLREHSSVQGTTATDIHEACVAAATACLMLSLYGDPGYSYEPAAVHDREDG